MKHSSKVKRKQKNYWNKTLNFRKIKHQNKPIFITIVWLFLWAAVAWGILFLNGNITLGGVPASIIIKFLKDPYSVAQFFLGHKTQLHNRLQSLGVEEEIKAYYRPKISDETKLDQYIHQILYDRTGYVGHDYFVSPEGILILKPSRKIY